MVISTSRQEGWFEMMLPNTALQRTGPKDERERFVAVLEIPPVDSAQKAAQVQIVKDAKGNK